MRIRTSLTAVFLATQPMPATAADTNIQLLSTTTAGTLAELCKDSDGALRDPCVQYILGVYDTLALNEKTCVPHSGSTRQVAAVVIKALRDRPEEWHDHAAYFISKTLKAAFPCK